MTLRQPSSNALDPIGEFHAKAIEDFPTLAERYAVAKASLTYELHKFIAVANAKSGMQPAPTNRGGGLGTVQYWTFHEAAIFAGKAVLASLCAGVECATNRVVSREDWDRQKVVEILQDAETVGRERLWDEVIKWLCEPGFPETEVRSVQLEADRAIACLATELAPDQTDWSEPDSPKRWAIVFGVSSDTIKRRFKDGTIRAKKLSDRSYQVDRRDIPAQRQ